MTIIGWIISLGGLAVLAIALFAYIRGEAVQITPQEHIDWERWE